MAKKYCPETHKVAFRDELDAKMALARRIRNDKGEVRVYQCPFCHKFHLTSQKKGEPNVRTR